MIDRFERKYGKYYVNNSPKKGLKGIAALKASLKIHSSVVERIPLVRTFTRLVGSARPARETWKSRVTGT